MDRKLIWLGRLGICFVALAISAAAQTTVTNSNNGTTNTVPVYTGTSTLGNSPISVSGSYVGIGTTNPQYPLDIESTNTTQLSLTNTTNSSSSALIGVTTSGGLSVAPSGASGGGDGTFDIHSTSRAQTLRIVNTSTAAAGVTGSLGFYGTSGFLTEGQVAGGWTAASTSNGFISFLVRESGAVNEVARINSTGLGIGTTSPGATLEVNGNVKLTAGSGASVTFQDGTQQTTAWTGMLCGGDYAESVDVAGARKHYGPGDVLAIDPKAEGKFLKSAEPYSTTVAGIYSTRPGMVGRRQTTPKNPDEVPMAMIGIVPTKVTAENGPIHPGDLLVTSSTLGYAMKGTDRGKLTGAVIGKALGSLDSGTGTIEVLVTLQ